MKEDKGYTDHRRWWLYSSTWPLIRHRSYVGQQNIETSDEILLCITIEAEQIAKAKCAVALA